MTEVCERPAYIRVDLSAIESNIRVLRSLCPKPDNIGVIAVVKAGAYGHGSVAVSRHLKAAGVERLAVATVPEGEHLRNQGITGPIHVFGNVLPSEMTACCSAHLIPTVCSQEAVIAMATARNAVNSPPQVQNGLGDVPPGSINIKIDTGMSRNGCQPEDLHTLVKTCDEHKLPIDAMFTHFADSWGSEDFTKQQLDTFLKAVAPYRQRGIRFHVANSGAILRGHGIDLDFIRPGITIYGLPPDTATPEFQSFGLRPSASIVSRPTLVKRLSRGRHVGYSMAHTVDGDEAWYATIPVGYADGYWRSLSDKGIVVRDKTGEHCRVVGRVSMDAISILLPGPVPLTETFTLLSADYDAQTSACGIAGAVGTISYEVATRLSTRLPRVYVTGGKASSSVPALTKDSY